MSNGSLQLIQLPDRFIQVQLGALKQIVNHHREDGVVVQFDAQELDRIDGAAVQFLLAVARLQGTNTQEALVINANDVMYEALSDMGVEDLITTDWKQNQQAA